MSSFKDNFTRGQGDQNLQYDDTAFYYFSISILTFVALLSGIFVILRLFKSESSIKRLNKFDKQYETKKKYLEQSFKSEKYNFKFFLLVIIFFGCLYFAYQTSTYITKKDDMKRFDPYEILDITRGASAAEIKKAYRKMVLLYHPDKNPSPEAAAKFLLVTKANECLTDETKRQVCEQFGSPDGPGSLQVAIAMPSFFQNKENHVTILAFFSVLFVMIVPVIVLIWLNSSQSKNNHGMLVDNYRLSFQSLSQNMAPSKYIEILGFCEEFKFQISRSEQEYYRKHTQFLEETYPTTKGHPATKGQKLLILRFEGIAIPQESQKDFAYLLRHAPNIIESALEHCLQINAMLPKTDRRYLSVQSLLNTIYFQQHFFQGVWSTKQEMCLMQISAVQEDKINFKKLSQKYRTLRALMNTPAEQRKYDIQVNMDEEKKQKFIEQVNQEVDAFPNMQIQFDVLLEEKDESGAHRATSQSNKTINVNIQAGQIFNLKVGITRENIPEQGEGSYAICHRYPYAKDMNIHIFVTDRERIFQYQSLTGQARYIEFNEKMALPEGEFSLEVHVKPDCYVGMDETFKLNIKVSPPTEKPQEDADIHPEDIEKFKEPTFVQKLLGQLQEQEPEEEEEDEIPDISKNLGNNNTKDDKEESDGEEEDEGKKAK